MAGVEAEVFDSAERSIPTGVYDPANVPLADNGWSRLSLWDRISALISYGTWTGSNYSAGRYVSSSDHFTIADLAVPSVDAFDEVSKQHDIAYDNAQKALEDALGSGQNSLTALGNYHDAIRAADADFLAGATSVTASTGWGQAVQTIGIVAMTVDYAYQSVLSFIDHALASGQSVSSSAYDAAQNARIEAEQNLLSWASALNVPTNETGEGIGGGGGGAEDPLVLAVHGSTISLTDAHTSNVFFDFYGNGHAVQTGWTGDNTGFLVLMQPSGSVTAASIVRNFHELAALNNAHSLVDESTDLFGKLKVWIDVDHDGVAQHDELHGLRDLGISSITTSSLVAHRNINGNMVSAVGSVSFTDGSQQDVDEVWLATSSTGGLLQTSSVGGLPNLDTASLPERSFATIASANMVVQSGGADTTTISFGIDSSSIVIDLNQYLRPDSQSIGATVPIDIILSGVISTTNISFERTSNDILLNIADKFHAIDIENFFSTKYDVSDLVIKIPGGHQIDGAGLLQFASSSFSATGIGAKAAIDVGAISPPGLEYREAFKPVWT